jgi:hypothetical protein
VGAFYSSSSRDWYSYPHRTRADQLRLSLFTLRRHQQLEAANITHVLSVLRLPLDSDHFNQFKGRKHLVIEVDDVEDENLLQHFVTTNAFIQEGLDGGGGVLVHWSVSCLSIKFLCLLSSPTLGPIGHCPVSLGTCCTTYSFRQSLRYVTNRIFGPLVTMVLHSGANTNRLRIVRWASLDQPHV